MTWWAWAVVAWCVVSFAAALLLGTAGAEISRRERQEAASRLLPPSARDDAALTAADDGRRHAAV